jgi:hypothetical protein
MAKKISPPKPTLVRNQNGQTFLEFILIMLIMVTISFTFLKGFRGLIGTRWEIMLRIIARPESTFNIP